MKPFNLEQAKAGKPICTRDGRPARIICFDAQNEDFPIVALITDDEGDETPETYTAHGGYYTNAGQRDSDLMMVTQERTVWVNLYRSVDGRGCYVGSTTADTEQEALDNRNTGTCYIGTFPITYEE